MLPTPPWLETTDGLKQHVLEILAHLFTARPTAVNLGAATRRLSRKLQEEIDAGKEPRAVAQELVAEAREIDAEDVGRNKLMSKWGGEWLVERGKREGGSGEGLNVMTVCNTGSLATSVCRACALSTCCAGAAGALTRRFGDNIGLRDSAWADHLPA